MEETIPAQVHDLPELVSRTITNFLDAARQAFGSDLRSAVLYGSGAEGRLRPTSDVNLLLVFSRFDAAKAGSFRGSFAAAHAAAGVTAMFLLESEVRDATELFGQKFSDVLRRHRLLYGPDPFSGVSVPRSAVIFRLKQVLLNLTLRLRETYVELGAAPEKLSAVIADAAGPLRSCAATLLELEGKPPAPPKEALLEYVQSLGEPGWDNVLVHISETRQREYLTPASADETMFRLADLAERLRARVNALV